MHKVYYEVAKIEFFFHLKLTKIIALILTNI